MRLQNLSIIVQLSHHWKVQQIIQNLKSTLKITVFVCIYIGMKGLFCNTIPFQISTVEATNIFGQKHGPGTFWVVEQTSHCERWDFEFGSNTTAKYQNSLKQILASFRTCCIAIDTFFLFTGFGLKIVHWRDLVDQPSPLLPEL